MDMGLYPTLVRFVFLPWVIIHAIQIIFNHIQPILALSMFNCSDNSWQHPNHTTRASFHWFSPPELEHWTPELYSTRGIIRKIFNDRILPNFIQNTPVVVERIKDKKKKKAFARGSSHAWAPATGTKTLHWLSGGSIRASEFALTTLYIVDVETYRPIFRKHCPSKPVY